MTTPELFPRPRRLEGFDDRARIDGPPVFVTDPTLPTQGFEIHIDGDGARVAHADDAGRRYAEATLGQLRRDDGSLPAVHIADSPDFAVRGHMLDVSRDRVPTMDALEHLVARLATCRYNQLQLYIEHTFAHPGHRTVWADASPITPDELTRLDRVCAEHGIDLVVNQNTFGHFERWLAHDAYRDRAECPDGFEIIPGVTLPPSVLAPTADNAAFALELVRNQTAHVTSRTVNIGGDEPFELGKGVSADRAARDGLGAVYVEHLRRITDPLIADGHDVWFWGDVIRNHPGMIGSLPGRGCTPLVWNYDAPDLVRPTVPAELAATFASIGIDLDAPTDFATIVEPFVAAGLPFVVAPGTSTWQSFTGRLDNARANLLDAAVTGRTTGATGFLVTDWGDSGHHQPPAVSLPPIAYGGAVAWCAATNTDLPVARVVDRLLVGDTAGVFGDVLERIGLLAGPDATGVVTQNSSPLFQAVVSSPANLSSGDPDPERLDAAIRVLDSARDDLDRTALDAADGDDLVAGVDAAIRLAHHGALVLDARGRGTRLDPSDAFAELDDAIRAQRAAWLRTSRPGELADSLAHLERRRDRYRN